ncbi:MAG: hypothetical protein A2729_03860 [Candidatus Buchananbacteria bacterium RIFCSPHIGHO2_01_FULL_39_14]|uniref:HTH arsR-type domain-containing protein n=2 Tax=Candidatus Buchananiibacteriota TaxID=1817903 RepID=A0A1G1YS65_9BACT|nr:MAG: hypothetical protein A2729_03860 [Candidatus Buchananbacteria bacterium RIFCSPHIGHO2_01_FULL_39_14]OGY48512.1 MAG: hypothetical protein A3D39_05040 [Candidatus Buchananbacteria bacterium RIFCSPHIGHO2_02_FULL_39_17]OGY54267.1 MAG: hypothetical protein A2912_04470 [Candidatus Buchananbacteria bacterium RIFCSPLOWO2_01_FULL_40_23b]
MRELEKILRAMASHRRLAILKYLRDHREASVGELAEKIDLSFKSTSKHLSILLAVDILEREPRSQQMFYSFSFSLKPVAKQIINFL